MELDFQSLFGLLCTAVYSLAETPQLHPPAFGLIYEGAISQPRETTSPGVNPSIDVWTNLCNLSLGSEMKNETGGNF
jgi:hypothetical protein